MLKRNIMLLVLVMAFSPVLMGQTSNVKFGSPTNEELAMTSYAPDESAPAVVLYESTRVWYDILTGKFKVYTEVKTRIKILKPEGKEYADVEIPYIYNEQDKSFREDISGLKAWAYNLENGKMVKTKMENNSISRERVDKAHMLLKFSIPQVKEGTVVEYQYKKESDYYFHIDTWVAQSDIPVAYTSYNLFIPEYFNFNVEETGLVETENKVSEEGIRFISAGGQALVCNGTRYEFVGRDLPAMKADSYVLCPLDYCKKVTAEIRGLEVPGELYENFTTSWEEIGRRLMGDEDFGKRIKRASPIKDLVASSGVEKETDVVKKMAAVYTALKSRLKWDGNYKMYAESASKTIKDGAGSNADLNFILLSAYREAGLDARPVVMSRRTKGRLPLTHPSLNKLNTFVVGVVLMSGPFAEDFILFHMETSHNLWTDKVAANKLTFLFEGGAKIEIMGNGQYQMMQFKVKATDTFKGGDIEVCPDGFSFLTYHEFYAHEGGSSTTETTCNGEPSRARVTLDTGPSAVTDLKASGVVEGDGVYYNLMGQPMTHPTQPGIYIHNGQKVVVK